MKTKLIIGLSFLIFLGGCDILKNIDIAQIEKTLNTKTPLTNDEVIRGLKDALSIGTNNAVGILSKANGFYGDPLVKVLFPPEVQYVADKLYSIGAGKLVDDFILKMNQGAETAVVKAGPVFVNAIKTMSFADAMSILKGSEDAATSYFKTNTSIQLATLFKPEVQKVLDQMQVTKYWTDVTSAYNKIPLTKKVETDLAKYVTEKTMDGLFKKLALEEKKIRTDPVARTTDILKRVFGSLDN